MSTNQVNEIGDFPSHGEYNSEETQNQTPGGTSKSSLDCPEHGISENINGRDNDNSAANSDYFSPRHQILQAKSSGEELQISHNKVKSRHKWIQETLLKESQSFDSANSDETGPKSSRSSRFSVGNASTNASSHSSRPKSSRHSLPASLQSKVESTTSIQDKVKRLSVSTESIHSRAGNDPKTSSASSISSSTTRSGGKSLSERVAMSHWSQSTLSPTSALRTREAALARARAAIEGRRKSREAAKARAAAVVEQLSNRSLNGSVGRDESGSQDGDEAQSREKDETGSKGSNKDRTSDFESNMPKSLSNSSEKRPAGALSRGAQMSKILDKRRKDEENRTKGSSSAIDNLAHDILDVQEDRREVPTAIAKHENQGEILQSGVDLESRRQITGPKNDADDKLMDKIPTCDDNVSKSTTSESDPTCDKVITDDETHDSDLKHRDQSAEVADRSSDSFDTDPIDEYPVASSSLSRNEYKECTSGYSTSDAVLAASRAAIAALADTEKNVNPSEQTFNSGAYEELGHVGISGNDQQSHHGENKMRNDVDQASGKITNNDMNIAGDSRIEPPKISSHGSQEPPVDYCGFHNLPQDHNEPFQSRSGFGAANNFSSSSSQSNESKPNGPGIIAVETNDSDGQVDKLLFRGDQSGTRQTSTTNTQYDTKQEEILDEQDAPSHSYSSFDCESQPSQPEPSPGPLWRKALEESSAKRSIIIPSPSESTVKKSTLSNKLLSSKFKGRKINSVVPPGVPKSLFNQYREEKNGSVAGMDMEVTVQEATFGEWKEVNFERMKFMVALALVGGFFPSIFAQLSCSFVTSATTVGDESVELELHYGLWKYTNIDSVLEGHSECVGYGSEFTGHLPIFPRVLGLAGLICGTIPLVVVFVYLCTLITNETCWIVSSRMLLLGITCQAGTFFIFASGECSGNKCGFGSGAWASLVSSIAWILLELEMKFNSPLRPPILKPGPGAVVIEKKSPGYVAKVKHSWQQLVNKSSREWETVPSLSRVAMKKQKERIDAGLNGVEDMEAGRAAPFSYKPPVGLM